MRVSISIKVSSGAEVIVFNEFAETDEQLRRLSQVLMYARDLEDALEAYIETLKEELEKP